MDATGASAGRQKGARLRPEPDPLRDAEGDRQFVTAVARGFDILRAFTARETLLGNQELAQRTGLPKPTVSRLTYTLTRLGYLTYLPRFAKYQLGVGVLALGHAALATAGLWRAARPLMQAIADETDAAVALGCRDGLEVLYVEHCPPAKAVTLQLGPGSRIPLATTAMGRAILCAMTETERAPVLEALERAAGADWPAQRAGLEDSLRLWPTYGFTTSFGAWRDEVHSVGTALVLPNDAGIIGLNCGAPAFIMNPERAMRVAGPRLVELARRLAAMAPT